MFKQLKYLTQILPSHEHVQFQWFIKNVQMNKESTENLLRKLQL